ncbi:MAG: biotin-dependent carboxyltransferase family protein [Negativicutes bacterium]|nr:biotin-dependent carboxyltransferase family protein [Negativicutes bacterium]
MIVVERAGFFTTVQDHGRNGYRASGLPPAGAIDSYAYLVANAMVGNNRQAALEMTLCGDSFRFECSRLVAITGADMQCRLDGELVAGWSSFVVKAGQRLEFGPAVSGCRAYLAVAGGIDVPLVMGSRSTLWRAGLGGYCGRALRSGDRLPVGRPETGVGQVGRLPGDLVEQADGQPVRLRIIPGPQADMFTAEGWQTLLSAVYLLDNNSDRMGCRLQGPAVRHRSGADVITDAMCWGAIQVPPDGQPIIAMADGQTTGGYAKIAVVFAADLGKLGQCRPGDRVCFRLGEESEAIAARQDQAARLRQAGRWAGERHGWRRLVVTVDGRDYRVEIREDFGSPAIRAEPAGRRQAGIYAVGEGDYD